MAIDIIIEEGAPNPEAVTEPTPLGGGEAERLASMNSKLDAIIAALGIAHGGGSDGDE